MDCLSKKKFNTKEWIFNTSDVFFNFIKCDCLRHLVERIQVSTIFFFSFQLFQEHYFSYEWTDDDIFLNSVYSCVNKHNSLSFLSLHSNVYSLTKDFQIPTAQRMEDSVFKLEPILMNARFKAWHMYKFLIAIIMLRSKSPQNLLA